MSGKARSALEASASKKIQLYVRKSSPDNGKSGRDASLRPGPKRLRHAALRSAKASDKTRSAETSFGAGREMSLQRRGHERTTQTFPKEAPSVQDRPLATLPALMDALRNVCDTLDAETSHGMAMSTAARAES